jgi:formate dehydrogenase major subunit
VLDVNPGDAARLRLTDGALVTVTSRRAAITIPVRLTDTVAPGELFTAFSFPDSPTNALTSDATATATGCPEYKVTAVALRPV